MTTITVRGNHSSERQEGEVEPLNSQSQDPKFKHLSVAVGPNLISGISIVSGFISAGFLIAGNFKIPYRDSIKKTGYQRPPQPTRINELASDLRQGRVDLPTAVLLNIRDKNVAKVLKHGDNGAYLDLSYFWSTEKSRPSGAYFFVVDGQHRILALQRLLSSNNTGDENWSDFKIPFVCMLGADENEEMDQFYVVNSKAKSVRTDLAYVLLKERADKDGEVYQALIERGREWQVDGQNIAQRLSDGSSVWRSRIRFPAMDKGSTIITNTSMVGSLKTLLSDSPLFKRASIDQRVRIIEAFWEGVKDSLPEAFKDPSEYSIQKGNGVYTLHEVLPDIIEIIRSNDWSITDPDAYASVLREPLDTLEGDNGRGETVKGADFWRASVDGAAGSYSSSAGRRVLAAKLRQLLPDLTVE